MYTINPDIALQRVIKLWGFEDWLVNDRQGNYCLKAMELSPGHHVSLHLHKQKDETFLIIEGMMVIERSGQDAHQQRSYFHKYTHGEREVEVYGEIARVGDRIKVKPGVWHRFYAIGAFPCRFLEVSNGDFDDDNERFPGELSR